MSTPGAPTARARIAGTGRGGRSPERGALPSGVAPTAPKRRKAAPVSSSIYMDPRDGAMMLYLREPPSANRWWRMWRGRMVLSTEARQYKQELATLAIAFKAVPFPRATTVRFSLFWHRGRKSGDLDKRLGVVIDALQGVAYENDSQITSIAAARFDSPNQHSVVVHVTPNTVAE